MLTQAELKRQLHYNPDTGIFTRLVSTARCVKVGDIAGFNSGGGYLQICVNYTTYPAHRLAWLYHYGNMPVSLIDHVNGIKHDNRIENLREANKQQNKFNSGKNSNNTSGFKGVHLDSESKVEKWIAQSSLDGKTYYLGRHKSKEDAYKAYQEFVAEHHGEFARL